MKKFVLAACAAASFIMIGISAASAHGCHREPDVGKHGWHRHVGPYCDRVEMPPPHEGRRHHHHDVLPPPPPRCREECVGVGPLRVCERKCH